MVTNKIGAQILWKAPELLKGQVSQLLLNATRQHCGERRATCWVLKLACHSGSGSDARESEGVPHSSGLRKPGFVEVARVDAKLFQTTVATTFVWYRGNEWPIVKFKALPGGNQLKRDWSAVGIFVPLGQVHLIGPGEKENGAPDLFGC